MLPEISGCAARADSTQPQVKQTPAARQTMRKFREVFISRAKRKLADAMCQARRRQGRESRAQMAQCQDFLASSLKAPTTSDNICHIKSLCCESEVVVIGH